MREIQKIVCGNLINLSKVERTSIHPKVAEKKQAGDKIKLCGILTKEKRCEFYNNFSSNAGAAAAGAVEAATRGASQGGCSSKAGMGESSTFF